MEERRQDQFRGALLGTALGDAIGAPFEGRRTVARPDVEAWLASDAQLTWTDDTAMMLVLGRSLVSGDGMVDPQVLGDAFASAYHREPWRGYGAGPPRIFAEAAAGRSYVDVAAELFGGSGSFGNGAAMRAAPAGLVGAGDPERAAELARHQSLVTHAHPLAQDGAAVVAMAVAVSTDGDHDPSEGLLGLTHHLRTPEFRRALQIAVELGAEAAPDRIARVLGHGVASVEAVPAAVAAFLGAPDDPTEVMVRAVSIGGDTDTIAAMAGAVAGARAGATALSAELLDRLEARAEIIALADELAALQR